MRSYKPEFLERRDRCQDNAMTPRKMVAVGVEIPSNPAPD